MIGIVGHWDCSQPIRQSPFALKKLLLMWTTTAKTFGVQSVYMVNSDKLNPCPETGDQEIDFKTFGSLAEVKARFPDHQFVHVEINGDTLLEDFVHPNDKVFYVFGSDYGGLTLNPEDISVRIVEGAVPLYAHISAAIVLYDRNKKL